MEQFLTDLAAGHPAIAQVLMVMSILRIIFKPLMTFLETVVIQLPTPTYKQMLDNVEGSKIYAALAWILDYTASIKLPTVMSVGSSSTPPPPGASK